MELLMDIEDQFKLDHLFLKERVCRTCHKSKNLLDDFYLIRKSRDNLASSYSYECKMCTIERVVQRRKSEIYDRWEYPDW